MGSVDGGRVDARPPGIGYHLSDLCLTMPRHPAAGLTRLLPTPELIDWYERAAELVAMVGANGAVHVMASELYGNPMSQWAHVALSELLVCLVEEQGSHSMTLSSFEDHMESCTEELEEAQARIDTLTNQHAGDRL
jgi:hypothetical protein